jgi:oxygen-independent coproporphyrinogen-3 oxidase
MPHLFKSQKQIDERYLPEPQEKLAILESSIEKLQSAGYVYIGMDHFAKPDDSLTIAQSNGELQRNFQGYATHGNCDLFAFGVSAISSIDNIFIQNHKDIANYTLDLANSHPPMLKGLKLSDDDMLRQAVINQLICHFELEFAPFNHAYGINFSDYFSDALDDIKPLINDRLISLDGSGIKISNDGRLLIMRICMAFYAYLKKPQAVKYSRII